MSETVRVENPWRTVVVKFDERLELPFDENGIQSHIERELPTQWRALVGRFPGIKFRRLFRSLSPPEIQVFLDRAELNDKTYRRRNLSAYFALEFPLVRGPEALAEAISSWRIVERAYVAGGPTKPPDANNDSPYSNPGHLGPKPDGIDAEYAWTKPGGDGGGIGFVDLEQGWVLEHEDLPANITMIRPSENRDYRGHGTSVLGVVVAVHEERGGIGIASGAHPRVISQWREPLDVDIDTADAINKAANVMASGDVLLLEVQTDVGSKFGLPVEVEIHVFDAIRSATAAGVIVVEAAGNGFHDLDEYRDSTDGYVLNRNHRDFQNRGDSRAIMVGAARSEVVGEAHPPLPGNPSNRGSRVDCYAWGENIITCGRGGSGTSPTTYTQNFGGTSGAAAIVTGAALAVQGFAEQRGERIGTRRMRNLLSNRDLNIPTTHPETDKLGVMPNLKNILDEL